jgi:hypothetical protein
VAVEDKSVQVEGLNQLLRALEQLDDLAKDDLKSLGLRAAEPVLTAARETVPVLTGALSSSIRSVRSARGVKIRAGSSRVPYAKVIHFGWARRNIKPNKFLFRAVDRSVDEVTTIYETGVIEIWNRNI